MKAKKTDALPGQKTLIVAEKRTVAREIAESILDQHTRSIDRSSGFISGFRCGVRIVVGHAEGHLYRLGEPHEYDPKWEEWSLVDLPIIPPSGNFRHFPQNMRLISSLEKEAKDATELVNACDAAREGELIFWEILTGLSVKPSKISRMWILANTPESLLDAFEQRGDQAKPLYQNLLLSAQLRQQADWLLGTNLSRWVSLCWPDGSNGKGAIAIGRVKTPTLSAIHHRCKEIEDFSPRRYYVASLWFYDRRNESYKTRLIARDSERFGNNPIHFSDYEVMAQRLSQARRYDHAFWEAFDTVERISEYPPAPFNLLELQRAAYREYGWSAKHTLDVAQEAYLRDKSISYPRTEAKAVPESMKDHLGKVWAHLAKNHFQSMNGFWPVVSEEIDDDEYANRSVAKPETQIDPFAQSAPLPSFGDRHFRKRIRGDHYAIVPTGRIPPHAPTDESESTNGYLRDAFQLWDLVARRFIVSMMPKARLVKLVRILRTIRDADELRALYDDTFVEEPGWLLIDDWIGGCSSQRIPLKSRLMYPDDFPFLHEGKSEFERGIWREAQTEPPLSYTDDSLLHYMGRSGLGTAATRSGIIEDLLKRQYLTRVSGKYEPTTMGRAIVEYLAEKGAFELLDSETTSTWEKILTEIAAKGEKNVRREGFLSDVISKVRYLGQLIDQRKLPDEIVFCPASNKRVEDHGEFYRFPGRPEVKCYKVVLGREMTPAEYRAIFLGGGDGAGPFEGFVSKNTGKPFTARLVFRPRLKRFNFDYRGIPRKKAD